MINLDPNTLLLFGIALLNAMTAFFAWRGQKAAVDTKAIALKTEINTNSMKDALVKATREAAHAAGADEQRVIGERRAATLALGALQGRDRDELAPASDGEPVPVADDRTAVAAERGAKATERIAAAAETTAAKK